MLIDGISLYIGTHVAGLSVSGQGSGSGADEDVSGNVFTDWIPSSPERSVSIIQTVGDTPDSKLPYDAPSFQIQARCEQGSPWAREILMAIYSQIHALRNITLPDGTVLIYILADQSSPFALGEDENGRPRFTLDFRAETYSPTEERP